MVTPWLQLPIITHWWSVYYNNIKTLQIGALQSYRLYCSEHVMLSYTTLCWSMRLTRLPGPQPVVSHPRMEALDSLDVDMKMNAEMWTLASAALYLKCHHILGLMQMRSGDGETILILTMVKLSQAFIVRVIKGVVSMAASGNCTDLLIPSCPSQTFKWKYGGSWNYILIHFNLILTIYNSMGLGRDENMKSS